MNIIRYIVMKLLDIREGETPLDSPIYLSTLNFIPMKDRNNGTLSKFQSMKYMIIENTFLTECQRKEYLELFSQAQAIHWNLCKLGRQFRWKKALTYNNSEDFFGNSLSTFKNNIKITLLQENTKYTFRLSDLLTIWVKALTYTEGMTPMPKIPKNPYIGLPFESHHLYEIYYHTRFNSMFQMPTYIESFYLHNFHIKHFQKDMYPLLREDAITSYLKDSASNVLYLDIINMINANKKIFKKRKIKENLEGSDCRRAVTLLKPILGFYLRGILSCNPFKKKRHFHLFKREVAAFLRRHPTFGRYIIPPRRSLRVTSNLNFLSPHSPPQFVALIPLSGAGDAILSDVDSDDDEGHGENVVVEGDIDFLINPYYDGS